MHSLIHRHSGLQRNGIIARVSYSPRLVFTARSRPFAAHGRLQRLVGPILALEHLLQILRNVDLSLSPLAFKVGLLLLQVLSLLINEHLLLL